MVYENEILGGLLIGLASAAPLILEGRVAGISGYAAGSLRPKSGEGLTGLMFVIGLVLGGVIWMGLGGKIPNPDNFVLDLWLWVVAGLLVGFGSRMGGGCTSGHGVCGLGRVSIRSLASVAIFMFFAILVTRLMRTFL